jgi:hypothetical protein
MYHNAGKGLAKYQDPGGLTSDQLLVFGCRLSRIRSLVDPFPMGEYAEVGVSSSKYFNFRYRLATDK